LVSPLTTKLVGTGLAPAGVLAVIPPGLDVAVYDVIALPPLLAGAVQLTVACPFPATARTPVGAPGGLSGVTATGVGDDSGPLPMAFVACTVNVYWMPFVSPFTTTLVAFAPLTVAVKPPGVDVAVYERILLPPLFPGSVQLTVACAFPATALTFVGAPGSVAGVTALDGADAGPGPTPFVA